MLQWIMIYHHFCFLIKSINRQQKAMAPIDPSLCNCQCDPFTYVDEDGIKQGNCIRYYDRTYTSDNLISNLISRWIEMTKLRSQSI